MSVTMTSFAAMRMRALMPLVAVTAVLWGCAPADGEQADPTAEDNQIRVVNVEVTPVVLRPFAEYVRVTGEVEALHDIMVAAEEAGVIREFFVRKGSFVRAGQEIARIADDVLAAQVEEARALADIADEQFARQRQLWEVERMGSEIAYLQAKASAGAANARLRTLEARLANTVVRAPVAGYFDDDFLELGEMAAPGAPVARIVSVQQVKITAGVPERYALQVNRGDSARVTLDAFRGREFHGRISFVGASVDAQSRTVPIEILLNNPDGTLKPRMVANVRVELGRLDNVVVVSQDIVVRTEAGYQVFVVQEVDGRAVARARSVTLGPSYDNRVVVLSGLEVDDPLITLGHRLVENQSRVRVVNRDRGAS